MLAPLAPRTANSANPANATFPLAPLAPLAPLKCYNIPMTAAEFRASLKQEIPPADLPATLKALWWDAKGDWTQAHSLVDEIETKDGMAVHAYLHRKEGADWNAEYWYDRAGRTFHRPNLPDEWSALVDGLCVE
jgi:hypothetical protein